MWLGLRRRSVTGGLMRRPDLSERYSGSPNAYRTSWLNLEEWSGEQMIELEQMCAR